jgi:putative SOS response-associated peptidase YedK
MCGRFVIDLTWSELVVLVRAVLSGPALNDLPRYNVAPTQQVPVVRPGDGGRELTSARWGLVPWWAKEDTGGRLINARAETLHSKASFRDAFQERRCLLPASGFYEWRREGKKRLPHYFSPKDGAPLALAGLWDRNRRLDVVSCTIVTVPANDDVAALHDRMPLSLPLQAWDTWLRAPSEEASALLEPPPAGLLTNVAVDPRVNSPHVEEASLIEPLGSGRLPGL